MPYTFRIAAARALLHSDLYFSIEIYALASKSEIDRIRKQIQSIGRFVLRKYRTEHISNERIYSTLKIYPIEVMIAIQTILFWSKMYNQEDSHPLLKEAAGSIFTNSRKASLKPRTMLIPPLQVLLDSFDLYKFQLQKNGSLETIAPKSIFQITKKRS